MFNVKEFALVRGLRFMAGLLPDSIQLGSLKKTPEVFVENVQSTGSFGPHQLGLMASSIFI